MNILRSFHFVNTLELQSSFVARRQEKIVAGKSGSTCTWQYPSQRMSEEDQYAMSQDNRVPLLQGAEWWEWAFNLYYTNKTVSIDIKSVLCDVWTTWKTFLKPRFGKKQLVVWKTSWWFSVVSYDCFCLDLICLTSCRQCKEVGGNENYPWKVQNIQKTSTSHHHRISWLIQCCNWVQQRSRTTARQSTGGALKLFLIHPPFFFQWKVRVSVFS